MTTALYRRYRPETFGEMIGQSQVTDPLMTALRGDRVGHAYLFSGPRGCGKTTSARILARCLNCAEGPTDTPCGVCESCVELSRNGGGSLDVVEIDAASHNGVDDARDLRERATFAPSRDRFKIFILDEAHMVTPQGFNALLKLVEEPPAHVKFIFATTEPEKVLGTIRSRTHHYPFRLVPPAAMLEYVEKLCAEEGVRVEQGVLPLVVRAGGGSPRDTLSLLDQLIAGSDVDSDSGAATVSYARAVALLGYTHAELLDEIVVALGAADAAAAFPAVDRVVQTGQDPRRFVDDLLERLRDLIVIAAVGDGASAVLRGIPDDELARMRAQAAAFGTARLSRTADVVSQALDDMTGATSPRLHLELLVARVLAGGEVAAAAPAAPAAPAAAAATPAARPAAAAPSPAASAPAGVASAGAAPAGAARDGSTPVASAPAQPVVSASSPAAATSAEESTAAESAAGQTAQAAAATPAPTGPVDFDRIRAAWSAILGRLETISRSSWLVVTAVQPLAYDTGSEVLTLGFSSPNDVAKFKGTTPGKGTSDHLRAAIEQELGVTVKYRPAPLPPAGGEGGPGGGAPNEPAPTTPSAPAATSRPAQDDAPASGWANPMQSPSGSAAPSTQAAPSSQAAPSQTAPSAQATSPRAPGPRASAAAVTDWAVAPIPSSAPTGAAPAADKPTPEASRSDASVAAAPTPRSAPAESAAPSASSAPARPAPQVATPQFPVDDEPAEVEAAASAPQPPVDGLVTEPAGSASVGANPYDDAPPYDDEPPYDPEYDGPVPADGRGAPSRPAAPAAARATTQSAQRPTPASAPVRTAPAAAPVVSSRSAAPQGVQRYGEAVVRQVLGATFVREEPYEPPTRFS